jgi:xanthine dehydrogenase accessory factor
MIDWVAPLLAKLKQGVPVVRMAVASVRGSAPREDGATLLFWLDETGQIASMGTIGGGHLEFTAMQIASDMLGQALPARKWQRFVLGASLGQCCGGVVELYWERFNSLADAQAFNNLDFSQTWLRYCAIDGTSSWVENARHAKVPEALLATKQTAIVSENGSRYFVERLQDNRQTLWIYGAGHVASALVRVLQDLPFRITWVDSRQQTLDKAMMQLSNATNLTQILPICEEPDVLAAQAPKQAWHIVMTHDHDEDMRICEALLNSKQYGFLGVIGSQSKAKRFRQRLLHKGFSPMLVEAMCCPIGITGISSKLPSAIAISIAFQLIQRLETMPKISSMTQEFIHA